MNSSLFISQGKMLREANPVYHSNEHGSCFGVLAVVKQRWGVPIYFRVTSLARRQQSTHRLLIKAAFGIHFSSALSLNNNNTEIDNNEWAAVANSLGAYENVVLVFIYV